MYSVELSRQSVKFLDKLDKHTKQRIEDSLKRLTEDPVPQDSKFIGRHKGEKIFRIRIGDYRSLYKVKENERVVLVTKIDKRDRIYQ